ncbi:MAG: ABC transporter permease [Dehalococcoidia bacterium]|nr:ABC transporter permease [Chloroflexota bacterium]MDP7613529.1 ABC transporter permease [Dehalococcoidia bacterium]
MRSYLLMRAVFAVVTVIAATFIVFTVSRLTGDPREMLIRPEGYGISEEAYEAIGKKLGLDKPLVVQYGMWIGRVVRGDFGKTLLTQRPVIDLFLEKAPATIKLSITSWILATLIGVPLGVLSAVYRGGFIDYVGRTFALFGQATPAFWLGIMVILIFSVLLNWLPSGTIGPEDASFIERAKYFVLPSIVLGWGGAAGYLRLTRSAMLEVLDSEFIRLARAKGVSNSRVVWKHAFRNALIPPLTFSALLMAFFLNGQVVIEVVFSWPGLGRLATESVFENDFNTLSTAVLFFAALFSLTAFIADVLYATIDPRIRLTGHKE